MNPSPLAGYGDIFGERGSTYAQAMRRWPEARTAEFKALFAARPVLPGERVLDVPAGGDYLRALLPQAQVTALEFSEGFSQGVPVVTPGSEWTGLADSPFDHVVCLAALHHIAEGDSLVRQLLDLLAAHGVLHLADVVADSRVARFLDGFAGHYNVTGHQGIYRPAKAGSWSNLGRVLRCEEITVPWRFATDQDMLDFTAGLFGLRNCPATDLLQALETQVGVVRDAHAVSLQWSLAYTDLAAH
jgi:SAM-dependent methyltransferase